MQENLHYAVVPIISPTSPVSNLSVFQAFLKECRLSFQLRRGLKLAVKGRGGGCGASRKKEPDATVLKKQEPTVPSVTGKQELLLVIPASHPNSAVRVQ